MTFIIHSKFGDEYLYFFVDCPTKCVYNDATTLCWYGTTVYNACNIDAHCKA